MNFSIEPVERHDDIRGKLIILLKKGDLRREMRTFGEIFYITFAKTGVVRANHYHKKWREWFIVVSGKLRVELEDVKTKERFSTILSDRDNPLVRLEIGPYVAHAFESLTSNACLVNYSNTVWKAEDVIPYVLIPTNEKTHQ